MKRGGDLVSASGDLLFCLIQGGLLGVRCHFLFDLVANRLAAVAECQYKENESRISDKDSENGKAEETEHLPWV